MRQEKLRFGCPERRSFCPCSALRRLFWALPASRFPLPAAVAAPEAIDVYFDRVTPALRPGNLAELDHAARLYRDGKPILMTAAAGTDPLARRKPTCAFLSCARTLCFSAWWRAAPRRTLPDCRQGCHRSGRSKRYAIRAKSARADNVEITNKRAKRLWFCPSRKTCLLFFLAAQTGPATIYTQAIQADLTHVFSRALAVYHQTAEAGLPDAQLNVAIMYDSGRGTRRDAAQAAIWFGQAAAGGIGRAAFDLAQLYAAGTACRGIRFRRRRGLRKRCGKAWRAAAGRVATGGPGGSYAAPILAYRPQSARIAAAQSGISLVWTQAPVTASEVFFVQVVHLVGAAQQPVFSVMAHVSAVQMRVEKPGHYAWRVFLLCLHRPDDTYRPAGRISLSSRSLLLAPACYCPLRRTAGLADPRARRIQRAYLQQGCSDHRPAGHRACRQRYRPPEPGARVRDLSNAYIVAFAGCG